MSKLGYTCTCGHFNPAEAYGAAHWHEKLNHTCTNCGQKNVIQHGEITSPEETVDNELPICPRCNEEIDDAHEFPDDLDLDCPSCGELLSINRRTIVRYNVRLRSV